MANPPRDGQTFTTPRGERFIMKGGKTYQMQAQKVDPHDDAEVEKLSNEAHNKRVLVDASHEFMRYNRTTSTGPWRGIPVVSEALQSTPDSPLYDPQVRAMEGINGRYAPQLRPVGSGRLMQVEFDAFKKALPKTTNGQQDNALLTQQYEKEAHKATAEAEFKRNWLHATGSLAGATEAFEKHYKDPSPPLAPEAHTPPPQDAATAAPQTAAPAASVPVHKMSDADLKKQLGIP